jgi:hypothetical protein
MEKGSQANAAPRPGDREKALEKAAKAHKAAKAEREKAHAKGMADLKAQRVQQLQEAEEQTGPKTDAPKLIRSKPAPEAEAAPEMEKGETGTHRPCPKRDMRVAKKVCAAGTCGYSDCSNFTPPVARPEDKPLVRQAKKDILEGTPEGNGKGKKKTPKEFYSRLQSVADALKEGIQKREELVTRSARLFANHGGAYNEREAEQDVIRALRLLSALNLGTMNGEKFVHKLD